MRDEQKIDQYYEITAFMASRRRLVKSEDSYALSLEEVVKAYILQLEEELKDRKEFIDDVLGQ